MTLRSFLIKRLIYTVVLVFVVIIVNWFVFEGIPGQNGAQALLSSSPKLASNPAAAARLCAEWNCHASRLAQFEAYIHAMLTFQFGISYQNGAPITQQIVGSGRLQNTLVLLGTSTIISIIIGIVLGVAAAHRRSSALDSFAVVGSLSTFALPTFWIGLVLIFFFSISTGWFPASGTQPADWSLGPSHVPNLLAQLPVRLEYLFLPALTLTIFTYGGFVLLTRATMMDALSEDYILTARAKGLTQRVILFRHAFKNASLPVITASALAFGGILSGAIITETVFNWAGLGYWLYQAVISKDYPVMQAMFYIISLTVIAANFIADVLYGVVDPRIRYE